MTIANPFSRIQDLLPFNEGRNRPAPTLQPRLVGNAIFPQVVAPENLRAAWRRVATNPGAQTPGVDGQICSEITRPGEWLELLADALIHDTYQPRRIRWVEIEKPSGEGKRRLGILTITDRVVHTAVKQVLEPLLDPKLAEMSFGYRPRRSPAHALARVVSHLESPERLPVYPWAAVLDIHHCFDSLDHHRLHETLERHIADPALLKLLARLMVPSAQYRREWWRRRRVGLVQGSALSPLLCNLYLDPLDRALEHLSADTGQAVAACRYADDLLILARNRGLMRRALYTARHTLGGLRMRFGERRTKIHPVLRGFSWLGVDLRPRPESWRGGLRFGYHVPQRKVEELLRRIEQLAAPRRPEDDLATCTAAQRLAELNAILRSWREAYAHADNAAVVFRDVDPFLFQHVAAMLRAETGLSRAALREAHLVRTPEGFRTWRFEGEELLSLSALPARPAPTGRRRRRC